MFKFLTIFASILAIAHLSSIQSKDSNWMEDKITDILNDFKSKVPDPWIFDDFEQKKNMGLYTLIFGTSDASLNGTTGFNIAKVEFDLDQWIGKVELSFPEIAATFRLYTTVDIVGIDLKTDATRYARITDFDLKYEFNVYNNTEDDIMYIRNSKVVIGVGTLEYKLDDTVYGIHVGDIISKLITEFGADIINDNKQLISIILSQIVQTIINTYFG